MTSIPRPSSHKLFPNRARVGGHLSRYLAQLLVAAPVVDSVELLARNFWLTPWVIREVASQPEPIEAAIRRVRRRRAAAPYLAEFRRADAEFQRLCILIRQERARGHVQTSGAPAAPSAFQRADRVVARCSRIKAAAAKAWHKLNDRVQPRPVVTARPPVSRPRARRSHRVVVPAAAASGDSGDGDGDPAGATDAPPLARQSGHVEVA